MGAEPSLCWTWSESPKTGFLRTKLMLQEQPNENLDDDEDKQNPAYIPRKGAFFEHDMRLDPDADERSMPGGGRG